MGEFTDIYTKVSQPAYEGATTSYRLEQKGLARGDQDAIAGKELQNLWARSHYLVRNNACSITAKKRLLANWIGTGITVRWTHPNKTPHRKMQAIWDNWIKECTLDTYGNFNSTQALWASSLFESGESLTRIVVSKRKTSSIPLALQVLESEQLDPMFTKGLSDPVPTGLTSDIVIPQNQVVRNGIGFENDVPITYYFWKNHPGSLKLTSAGNKRIPISAEDIIHIFERERPGQWRGVPMLAPVLLNIYEMDELVDATLQRQKAAQTISWIIENTSPTSALAPGIVRSSTDASDIDPITGNRKKIIQAAGGGVQYLNKGESIKFSSISDIGANLQILLEDEWSKIASALGLAYHQMTGDLSSVNFSSIRAGLNELRVRVEMVQQNLFITLGLEKVTKRFKEFVMLYESKALGAAIPTYYCPRRYGVDELKDAQADLMEVQAGFATLESKLAERGMTFEEIVADRQKVKAAKLSISSIPETIQPDNSATTVADNTTNSDKSNPAKTQPEKP